MASATSEFSLLLQHSKEMHSAGTVDFFFYQNVSVYNISKIYKAGRPASSNTKIYKKGTSSLIKLYIKAKKTKLAS
jgi:hypothetical protein